MTTDIDTLPSTQDITHNVDDHYGLTVRISIGKGANAKVFDVHRGVLQFYPGYFRTAIKNIDDGKFSEGVNDVITLPEDDQTAFTLFRRWLYAPGRRMTAPAAILRHEYKNFDYDTLAKLWCFAALRIIPMLQNRAIDLIIAKMAAGDKMSTSTLRHVSTESSNDSPLRKLVVFYNAHHQCFEMSDDMKKDELSSDGWFGKFSTETMLERATGLPVDTTSYRNQAATWFRCTYHVHERGAKCGSMGWNQS